MKQILHFSQKQQDGSVPNFFQGLGKNTCLLQPALKTLHQPGLYPNSYKKEIQ